MVSNGIGGKNYRVSPGIVFGKLSTIFRFMTKSPQKTLQINFQIPISDYHYPLPFPITAFKIYAHPPKTPSPLSFLVKSFWSNLTTKKIYDTIVLE